MEENIIVSANFGIDEDQLIVLNPDEHFKMFMDCDSYKVESSCTSKYNPAYKISTAQDYEVIIYKRKH